MAMVQARTAARIQRFWRKRRSRRSRITIPFLEELCNKYTLLFDIGDFPCNSPADQIMSGRGSKPFISSLFSFCAPGPRLQGAGKLPPFWRHHAQDTKNEPSAANACYARLASKCITIRLVVLER